MSEGGRSFWTSVPGLITGIAGLLTGIVGLITLGVQQGIIGDDSADKPPPNVTTTIAGATTTMATAPGGTGPATTTAAGTFSVAPRTLDFPLAGPREKEVTVRNTSSTASIVVQRPQLIGDNAAQFSAAFGTCTSAPLAPNLSCTIKVTFNPPAGALQRYVATLRALADGAPGGQEVALTASTLL